MTAFLKGKGFKGRALRRECAKLGLGDAGDAEPELLETRPAMEADLSWHVRAWGRQVLMAARRRLADRYPTYAAFQALAPGLEPFEARPLTLLSPDADGETDVRSLNTEFDAAWLEDRRKPRWVAEPTVAYLWARTVRCKGCRATIPCQRALRNASIRTDHRPQHVVGVYVVAPSDEGQSGRACAEPPSRPLAPRSGGGAQRRALTAMSTREHCRPRRRRSTTTSCGRPSARNPHIPALANTQDPLAREEGHQARGADDDAERRARRRRIRRRGGRA